MSLSFVTRTTISPTSVNFTALLKILIAEDDPVSRRLLAATLDKFGYEVVVAANGAEAWAALQRDDAPHLAVLDWMMPELDGVAFWRRVRALPTITLHTARRFVTSRITGSGLIAI